jgi:nucleolar protein 56
MECYLIGIFAGNIALDENFNLIDYELFPKDKLLEKYLMNLEGKISPEENDLITRLSNKGYQIIIEANKPYSRYIQHYKDLDIILYDDVPAGRYLRSNMELILEKTGFINFPGDLRNIIHDLSLSITEEQLRKESHADDLILIQAINAIEEVEEAEVRMVDRLREWYAHHFPELDEVKDHTYYVSLVSEYGDRDGIIRSGYVDDIENSLGADISGEDIEILQNYAQTLQSLQKTKKSLKKYVENKMEEIAPNLMAITSASLGAKLIAHTGSIKRLAMLPSSTIQILGAEKALFRHLKTGDRPPKHGLIYQHPMVRGSKWWIRGKISRALASKIALAIRIDYFNGEKDANIVNDFHEHVKKIEKSNPFPKKISKKKKVKKKKKGKKRFSKKELKDIY